MTTDVNILSQDASSSLSRYGTLFLHALSRHFVGTGLYSLLPAWSITGGHDTSATSDVRSHTAQAACRVWLARTGLQSAGTTETEAALLLLVRACRSRRQPTAHSAGHSVSLLPFPVFWGILLEIGRGCWGVLKPESIIYCKLLLIFKEGNTGSLKGWEALGFSAHGLLFWPDVS